MSHKDLFACCKCTENMANKVEQRFKNIGYITE